MSDELTPITRKETFLAKAGGQSVETPTPITREETFLQAIIDNGGGGGGGTGWGVLVVTEDAQTGTFDKTWNEINDAAFAIIKRPDFFGTTFSFIAGIFPGNGETPYSITVFDNDGESFMVRFYETDSADGYPVVNMG